MLRRAAADQSTFNSQLTMVVNGLMEGTITPSQAAIDTSNILTERDNIDDDYGYFPGPILSAAESADDNVQSEALSDYLVALAHLPDVVNTKDTPMYIDTLGGHLLIFPRAA